MSEKLIWPLPKPKRRQGFKVAGVRSEGDPALLPCGGVCSKPTITWTRHQRIQGTLFACDVCTARRQWGLQYWCP